MRYILTYLNYVYVVGIHLSRDYIFLRLNIPSQNNDAVLRNSCKHLSLKRHYFLYVYYKKIDCNRYI